VPEVITTPYSFFATAGAVARLGARPVFVDIDPATCNLRPDRVEAAVTARTKVVLPVHLYGQCADMALARDPDLAERVRDLRVHGSKPKYYHQGIGGNFRLDAIQAAVLNVTFDRLDARTRGRQENAKRYMALFRNSGLLEKPGGRLPEIAYPGVPHGHIFNQVVIRVPERDRLLAITMPLYVIDLNIKI
jgi:dTDP-4-amino-4,6-dideoxygalactose transaminase